MPNIIASVSTDDTNPSSAHEDAVKSLIKGGFGERQAREIIASVRGEAQEVGHRAGLRRAIDATRAEVLRDAADLLDALRDFSPSYGARKAAQISENVGILRATAELRRMADEAATGGAS
ncbi:hypothetical protein [Streptomyces sp. NPDC059802]|uniref:hypothetical protein n=1 Tax=Streptomyces sp. NPDC059802 TaxID=3346952 RepID=UPI00364D8964